MISVHRDAGLQLVNCKIICSVDNEWHDHASVLCVVTYQMNTFFLIAAFDNSVINWLMIVEVVYIS